MITLDVNIPLSLSKYITVGEIIKTDLIYKPTTNKQYTNLWKVIYIYPKEQPIELLKHNHGGYIINKVRIPIQDIGEMVGIKGKHINKIAKSLLYNNPNMSKYMGVTKAEKFPQIDINNTNDYTIIKSFHQPNTFKNSKYNYDFIRDVIMKLYI